MMVRFASFTLRRVGKAEARIGHDVTERPVLRVRFRSKAELRAMLARDPAKLSRWFSTCLDKLAAAPPWQSQHRDSL
jgi:hypothetical protein